MSKTQEPVLASFKKDDSETFRTYYVIAGKFEVNLYLQARD